MNKHIGSKFDDFLQKENIFDEVEAIAIKKVIAYQMQKTLKDKHKDKHFSNSRASCDESSSLETRA